VSQVDWDWTKDSPFTPRPLPTFDDSNSGFNFGDSEPLSELDFFNIMFTPSALALCVEQSNAHFHRQPGTTRRAQNFKDISQSDLIKVIAAKIIMGLNHKPEMTHYWSENKILGGSIIPTFISSERFFEICQFLHFNEPNPESNDRIEKIRNVWELIFSNFKSIFTPFENVGLDESLILFKGRLFWRQYNPKKASKFGVKTFSLVDSKTGFLIDSKIYSGKESSAEQPLNMFGQGGSLVLDFLQPHFFKSHTVFLDNFFTSPNLAFELLLKGTKLCGTVRKTRKNMPPLDKKLAKGSISTFNSNGVLIEQIYDRRVVNIISTYTRHELVTVKSKNTGAIKLKTKSVADYNIHARGVDGADQMMQPYTILRKTYKW